MPYPVIGPQPVHWRIAGVRVFDNISIPTILVSYVALLFSLSVHEACHASATAPQPVKSLKKSQG